MAENEQITQLLAELTNGNKQVVDSLMPLVYKELHQIAHLNLRNERRDHTLNATALVHEAYFKLVDQTRVNWQNRAHFYAIASQAMRRILINYAYQHKARKRGGDNVKVTFVDENVKRESKPEELIALDEYWFFVGLTHEEIAEVLGISVPTVRRDWRLARAWLSRELKKNL